MKCKLSEDGLICILAEDGAERYALKRWKEKPFDSSGGLNIAIGYHDEQVMLDDIIAMAKTEEI